MNRKVPVRFGGGEKMEITSKSYLFLSAALTGLSYRSGSNGVGHVHVLRHGRRAAHPCADYESKALEI